MDRKKIFVIICMVILIIAIIIGILLKNDYKNLKNGHTMINQTSQEVEAYILNLNSYEASVEVTVDSNKNSNKYVLKQEYQSPNIEKQEVIQPSNIEGMQTVYDGVNLTISNTRLNLTAIYENYPYIADNILWLNSFIQDYKTNVNTMQEKDDEIIMQVKLENSPNQYVGYKELHIDKKTGEPSKLIIQDKNKKTLVYILYSEIKMNQ